MVLNGGKLRRVESTTFLMKMHKCCNKNFNSLIFKEPCKGEAEQKCSCSALHALLMSHDLH